MYEAKTSVSYPRPISTEEGGISREINEMHRETENEARQPFKRNVKKVPTSDAEFAIVEIKRDSLFLRSNIRINCSTFFPKRLR